MKNGTLTYTDRRILQLIQEGFTHKEIAHQLKFKPKTITSKVAMMKRHHNCKNVTQLILTVMDKNPLNNY